MSMHTVYYHGVANTPYIKAEGLELTLEELREHVNPTGYIISYSKILKVTKSRDDYSFRTLLRKQGLMGRGRYAWVSGKFVESYFKQEVLA